MDASASQSVFFLKPVAGRGHPENENVVVVYEYFPHKQWEIAGFWIKNPKWAVKVRFYADETLLSEVEVSPGRGNFVKVPLFPEKFPLYAIRNQRCFIQVVESSGTLPLYIGYREVNIDVRDKTMSIKNAKGDEIWFQYGSAHLRNHDQDDSPVRSITYAEAMASLAKAVTSSEDTHIVKTVKIIDSHVYLKALIDMGLNNFSITTEGGDEADLFIQL